MKKNNLLIYFIYALLVTSSMSINSSSVLGESKIFDVRSSKNIEVDPSTSDQIFLDQVSKKTSTEFIIDTISLLKQRKLDSGNWSLSTLTDDNGIYYGLAGGLAGIGMKLLEARNFPLLENETDILFDLLNISEEIAQELILVGLVNSTHASWNISNKIEIVDLGWDFGIAGISAFYSELYNQTTNSLYQEIAFKTLVTISDMANHQNGLSWSSELYAILSDTHPLFNNIWWYEPLDFGFYDSDYLPVTFSGIAFGTAGVAKSALKYLSDTNDQSNSTANTILTESINYLESVSIVNGSETSFLIAEELIGLKSTNKANGVSGIAKLFMELYTYTTNTTYLDYTMDIINWINGTVGDDDRLFYSYELNGTLEANLELGLTYGIAGVIEVLFDIGATLSNSSIIDLSTSLTTYLYTFRVPIGEDKLTFPESIINDNTWLSGSTSWAFGMAGIFEVLHQQAQFSEDTLSHARLTKIKNYILTQTIQEDNLTAIFYSQTVSIEINPILGIPGFLKLLSLLTKGQLILQETTLDFGNTEIGTTNILSLTFENLGESKVATSWNQSQSSDLFFAEQSSRVIGEREIYKLQVTFSPSSEQQETTNWVITADNSEFTVNLIGLGFDRPSIDLTSNLANNSLISYHTTIDFKLKITDSSEILSVGATLDKSSNIDNLIYDSAEDVYLVSFNTQSLNGTHDVLFKATDTLGFSNQLLFAFEINVVTPNVVDKLVSDDTRNILIGVVIGLIFVAIFVTRRYMN